MKLTREEIDRRCSEVFDGYSPLPPGQEDHVATVFWENRFTCHAAERGYTPIYNLTLKDSDENGTLSVYQLYMQCASEYEAALVIMGSQALWSDLCATNWFRPHIERWRVEMALRDASIGRAAMVRKASAGDAAAGKNLIEVARRDMPAKIKRPSPSAVPEGKGSSLLDDVLGRASEVAASLGKPGRLN